MSYKKAFVFLLLGIVLFVSQQHPLKLAHASGTTVTITSQQIGPISQDFVGLSTEEQNICTLVLQEQKHHEIDTYLTNLNPLIMRIGGSSADETVWSPTGAGCPSNGNGMGIADISQSIINSVFALARKDNFHVFWTVNLKADRPDEFAQEAQYVVQAGGSNLAGIEIGNEPDLYGGSWTYQAYQPIWEKYYTTIKGLVPQATIVSPDTAYGIRNAMCNDSSSWLQKFLPAEGTKVHPASFHTYFSNASNASISYILDASHMATEKAWLSCDAAAAHKVPVPIFATEFNSSSQAVDGTTNVFADSLWGLDFLLNAGEAGLSGADAYGSYYPGLPADDQAFVQLPDGTLQAAALYYPMFLFHNLAQGGTLVQATTNTSINFVAHAVVSSNRSLQIFLINKDQMNDTTVQVTLPTGYTSGTGIWLQAPALNSKTVTLGGSSIAEDGTWSPTNVQNVSVRNNSFTIAVPHASAIAITLP